MISIPQIRAGRALVGWSQERLGKAAGLSADGISPIETGRVVPRAVTMRDAWRRSRPPASSSCRGAPGFGGHREAPGPAFAVDWDQITPAAVGGPSVGRPLLPRGGRLALRAPKPLCPVQPAFRQADRHPTAAHCARALTPAQYVSSADRPASRQATRIAPARASALRPQRVRIRVR
jgi:hypothetical protein